MLYSEIFNKILLEDKEHDTQPKQLNTTAATRSTDDKNKRFSPPPECKHGAFIGWRKMETFQDACSSSIRSSILYKDPSEGTSILQASSYLQKTAFSLIIARP